MGVPARFFKRRSFLRSAAGVGMLAACGGRIGAPERLKRVGILSSGTARAETDPPYAAFREGMRTEGFVEGTHYEVFYRHANGDYSLLVPHALDLVERGAHVIVTSSTAPTQAARAVTDKVPIVMVASHDPLEAGVIKSLVRPGENVTGQSLSGGAQMPIQLELLRQVATVRRIGYLSPSTPSYGPTYPSVTDIFEQSFRKAASAAGIEVSAAPKIPDPRDVGAVLRSLPSSLDALFVIESPAWFAEVQIRPINDVVDFATKRRLPTVSGLRMYAQAGILVTYGENSTALWGTVTHHVAEVLRGTPARDLPVVEPKTFELAINLKTAAAIGVEISGPLLARAAVTY